jgi:serine/threonine-protein kinase RIO1
MLKLNLSKAGAEIKSVPYVTIVSQAVAQKASQDSESLAMDVQNIFKQSYKTCFSTTHTGCIVSCHRNYF